MNSTSFPLYIVESPGFLISEALPHLLRKHSHFAHDIVLVSREPECAKRASCLGMPLIAPTLWDAIQNNPESQGAFVLSTAASPPAYWDKILHIAAMQDPLCGTASPLYGDFFPTDLVGDGTALNAFLWAQKDKFVVEAPAHCPDCFFLTQQALTLAKKAPPEARRIPLADYLIHQGLIHLMHANLYVSSRQGVPQEYPQPSTNPALLAWRHLILDKQHQGYRHKNSPGYDARPVQLHIIHSWGGGLEKWCRDFCTHDTTRCNLVLRSVGTWGAFGQQLELFSDLTDNGPLATWSLTTPIRATDIHNAGYSRILQEIIERFGVNAIIVSSYIGHSLDILRTGLPTLQVVHDYYPFCPTISTFNKTMCTACSTKDLEACHASGKMHAFFNNINAIEWTAVRDAYFSRLSQARIPLIAPTPAAKHHLETLDPRFQTLPIIVVEHGNEPLGYAPTDKQLTIGTRQKVLILGELRHEKGADILARIIPDILKIADVYLLGCGDSGRGYATMRGVQVLSRYERKELGTLLKMLEPDLALLISTCPETYSYTLSELIQAHTPALATNLGSFKARIEDGVTGFLCTPDAEAILTTLRALLHSSEMLRKVATNLQRITLKSIPEMTDEYNRLLPVPPLEPTRIQPTLGMIPQNAAVTHCISVGMPFDVFIREGLAYLKEKNTIFKRQSRAKTLVCSTLIAAFMLIKKLRQ